MRNPSKIYLLGALATLSISPVTATAQTVETDRVASTADQTIEVLGYLEPIDDANLTTSEAGRVSEIFVELGDTVKKGDPILKLDTMAHESGLEIAKIQAESTASIDAATAEKGLAQIKYDALKRISGDSRSNAELLRAEANLQIAEAKLQTAVEEKAMAVHQVTKLEAEINRRYIKSPIDGMVVDITLDVSEFLSPSEESIAHVIRLDKLYLNVAVNELYTRALSKGMPLPIRVVGDEIQAVGIIDFIAPNLDAASGTRRVRLLVENPDLKIRSGSQAYVAVARKPAS